MTQLATDLTPTAPLKSRPQSVQLETCPMRHRCIMATHVAGGRLEVRIVELPRSEADTPCGFEQARKVRGCPKRKRLEAT